jgi:hypothetical protein
MEEGSQVKGAVQREFGELWSGLALRHQLTDQKGTGSSAFTCSRVASSKNVTGERTYSMAASSSSIYV